MPYPKKWIDQIKSNQPDFKEIVAGGNIQVDDDDIDELMSSILSAKNHHINSLVFPEQGITDNSLQSMTKLNTLVSLSLPDNELTDNAAETLAKLPFLIFIDVSRNNISQQGLYKLLSSQSLKTIIVSDLKINNQIVPLILQNSQLTQLNIDDSLLTDTNKIQIKDHLNLNKDKQSQSEYDLQHFGKMSPHLH